MITRWNKSHLTIPKNKSNSSYAEAVETEISRDSIICDVGAGTGADTLYFLEHGHSVIALDISDTALSLIQENAKEKHLESQLTIKQVDLSERSLPLDDNSVDCIYSRLALHYFLLDNTAKIFKEMYRALKNGGKAFITVKSLEDTDEMQYLRSTATEKEPGVFVDPDGTLKSRFTNEQWRTILKKAGISNYHVGTYLEDLTGRTDKTKSGNEKLLLTEIKFTKV